MRDRRDLFAYAAFIAVGVAFVVLWSQASGGVVAYDIYQYWLPNMLYGLQRLHAGGSGLLWNPFQNCGQPAFGISSVGFLYPLNLLFVGLDADLVTRLQMMADFAVAGTGMYWLARELGTGRAAAFCAALAFEVGPATVDINTWTPQVSNAFVWMPMAMCFCERLLRQRPFLNAVGLGATLAIALLPGSPQVLFFTYQLIVLRVLFEYATRRPAPDWRVGAATVLGLALGPLIDAVQLLPGAEIAANSVRGGSLGPTEINVDMNLTLARWRQAAAFRIDGFNPLLLVPGMLASASWMRAATRRRAVFYVITGMLYFALAFGHETPLFGLYLKLPFGALFREPVRFAWVPSFSAAVLTGLGVDAILCCIRTVPRWCVAAALAGMVAVVVAFCWVSAGYPRGLEWPLLIMVIAALPVARYGARRIAAALLVATTAASLLTYGSPGLPRPMNAIATRSMSLRRLLPANVVYNKYADVFASLHARMTPQDRVFIVHANDNHSLAPKVASLFQLPSIDDYEPQPSRRWAEFLVMLRIGAKMTNLNQAYYPRMDRFMPTFRRPLLDLAAVRYVIVDNTLATGTRTLVPTVFQIAASSDAKVAVYENREALPRAMYVPRVVVVRDSQDMLQRLAQRRDDPRSVALVETPPDSGFVGSNDVSSPGGIEFVDDDPERVVLRVSAPARGFLYLADQYAAGWHATVNDTATPILRANYAFRAVEVPAGESVVEFYYSPRSVWIGAAISAGTIVALALVGIVGRARRRSHAAWPAAAATRPALEPPLGLAERSSARGGGADAPGEVR